MGGGGILLALRLRFTEGSKYSRVASSPSVISIELSGGVGLAVLVVQFEERCAPFAFTASSFNSK